MNKYLILGDAILDHYIYGIVHRQSPEDPSISIVDKVSEEYLLGGCLNAAANVKALSNRIKDEVYVSSIISDFTAEKLKTKKINYDAIVLSSEKLPHERELVKTRVCDSETHKQYIRIDNHLQFSEGDIQRYKNRCFYYNAKDFNAIVISDYNKGIIGDYVLEGLKNVSCPIFVDTKNPNFYRWKDLSDKVIFKINKKEWKAIEWSGHPYLVIVTDGDKGAKLWDGKNFTQEFPTKHISHADVVGAGDSFLAGLVVRYTETKDLYGSIEYANKVAGVAVQKYGTYEVKREEIK